MAEANTEEKSALHDNANKIASISYNALMQWLIFFANHCQWSINRIRVMEHERPFFAARFAIGSDQRSAIRTPHFKSLAKYGEES